MNVYTLFPIIYFPFEVWNIMDESHKRQEVERMMDKAKAYSPKRGGAEVEDTAYGFNIVVHKPANTAGLERRVAQAHADAIIARVKRLNCSAEQKKELIDAVCT